MPNPLKAAVAGAVVCVPLLLWSSESPSIRQGGAPQDLDSRLWSEMLAAEDVRATAPEQLAPLFTGVRSPDPDIRRIAVRALGRLERPALVPAILPLLSDGAPAVRAEAANALGQAVFRADGEHVMSHLLARLIDESEPEVRGTVAQTLGRLRYTSSDSARVVERSLVHASADAATATLVGIVRGLESLIRRQDDKLVPTAQTMERLRALARYRSQASPREAARVRRLATAALVRGDRVDGGFLEAALADPDAEVRRLATGAAVSLDTLTARERVIAAALHDGSAAVRHVALRAYGRWVQPAAGCDPVLEALDDPDAHVALVAIDALGNGCGPDGAQADVLESIAGGLLPHTNAWHRPAHALVALANVAPERAAALMPPFVAHETWWVRMYAARAAARVPAEEHLERLAFDAHDNVREAAIAGLSQIVGHAADSIYIAQLGRPDYQLAITAARALEGTPDAEVAIPALLDALARITTERRETSRDVRRAVVQRVASLGGPAHAEALEPYLRDFDSVIAHDAARILTAWTGEPHAASPVPLAAQALPSLDEVRRLSSARPVLLMRGGGNVELRLLSFEAPTNAARFVRLARAGYFDGLTFHRVVPGFVIQGGSPGANEYAGDGPYTRDELTVRSHRRGTVGVSTRGRDTGDGQIFINLVDNPRLDHNYTIFAEVVSGMDVVDGILEGATIERVIWR